MTVSPETTPSSPPSTTEMPACPAPQSWQDVLSGFHQESDLVTAETPLGSVEGRVLGEGLPLLFLGGFAGAPEQFALTAWLLRNECRCLLVDYSLLPNRTGESAEQQTRAVSASLSTWVEQCGVDSFSILGTSFGAQVAVQMLLDEPDRISHALLHRACIARKFTLLERALIRWGRNRDTELGGSQVVRHVLARSDRAWFPMLDPTRWDFFAANVGHTPVAQVARRAWVSQAGPSADKLASIGTPIVLLECEGDGLLARQQQQRLQGCLRAARTQTLENTGRLPHVTHPHRLAKVIREFVFDS